MWAGKVETDGDRKITGYEGKNKAAEGTFAASTTPGQACAYWQANPPPKK